MTDFSFFYKLARGTYCFFNWNMSVWHMLII